MAKEINGPHLTRALTFFCKYIITMKPFDFVSLIIMTLASGIMSGIMTYCWRFVFNTVYYIEQGAFTVDMLYWPITMLATTLLAAHALTLLAAVYQVKLFDSIKIALHDKLLEQIACKPYVMVEDPGFHDLISRSSSVISRGTINAFFVDVLSALKQLFSVISICAVLVSFSPILLLVSILNVLPIGIARMSKGARYYRLKVYQTPMIRIVTYLWSLLFNYQSLKECRVFGGSGYLKSKWRLYDKRLRDEEWEFSKRQTLVQIAVDSSVSLGFAGGIIILIWTFTNGNIEIGAFGAALASLRTMQNSFRQFLTRFASLDERARHLSDIHNLFMVRDSDNEGSVQVHQLTEIRLDGVGFAYPGTGHNTVENINITLYKGDTIAIVGPNGAGKTTLAKLIIGLYCPTNGSIYYNGINGKCCNVRSIQRNFSVIFQDFVRYKLTLRENLGFGKVNQIEKDDQYMTVIDKADLREIIRKMSNGLDSQLGREFGGHELSGGEWQKIAIARAIMADRSVIILDEPTASLDPIAEAKFYQQVIQNSRDKLTIIISHRIASAKLASKIIVMGEGRIIEVGSHQHLMQQHGKYYELYREQAKLYEVSGY